MHIFYHHLRGFHHRHHHQDPVALLMTSLQVLWQQLAVQAQPPTTSSTRNQHYLAGTDSIHWWPSVDLQPQCVSVLPATMLVMLHESTATILKFVLEIITLTAGVLHTPNCVWVGLKYTAFYFLLVHVIMTVVSKMTESLHGHCTNERRVRKRDKKVRRDVI